VLDPFVGSGTTAVVALRLGRKASDRRLSRLPRSSPETNPGGRGTAATPRQTPFNHAVKVSHGRCAECGAETRFEWVARMFGSRRSNRLDPRNHLLALLHPPPLVVGRMAWNNPIRSLEPVFQNCRRRRSHLRALNSFVEAYALCLGLPLACRCGIRYQPRFRGRNSLKSRRHRIAHSTHRGPGLPIEGRPLGGT